MYKTEIHNANLRSPIKNMFLIATDLLNYANNN